MDLASAMPTHVDWELQSYTPSHSHCLQRSIAAVGQGRKANHLLTPVLAWLSRAGIASPAAHTGPGLEYYRLLCPVTNHSYDDTETFHFGVGEEEKNIFIPTSGK